MPAKELVHENVFIEWRDLHTSTKSTLGSLCLASKKETTVKLRAETDESGVEVCLYLEATIRLLCAKGPRRKQIFLGIPLRAVKSMHVEKLSLGDLEEAAVARAINEAGLTNSGSVVRTTFHLDNREGLEAFMAMDTIKPFNSTASDLLDGLRSLSIAQEFSVFASWSSYAQVSLEQLNQGLSAFVQRAHDFWCSESSRRARSLDWERVQWNALPRPVRARPLSPPPAYPLEVEKAPPSKTRPHVTSIQVPESDSRDCYAEAAVSKNPVYIQVEKSPSLQCGKSPSVRDPGSVIPDSPVAPFRPAAQTSPPSSPRHRNNRKRPRQSSPPSYEFAPILNRPEEFNTWMLTLRTHNIRPHSHRRMQPHLGALGQHIRNRDYDAADVERARCTALGCFDPSDDATNDELERATDMLGQMTSLSLWINKLKPYGDVKMFTVLSMIGQAARNKVASNVHDDDDDDSNVPNHFDVLMGLCEADALILFGRAQERHKCAVC
ncbi:hypothetical protein BKA81DRAFT_411221 [Phyllosticta paracitricarpa]|uniref:Uncharacterized protein n=1 Tax=Phyllosticta paracitricarpa TaxID=2016321 RepID=A0ABR1MUM3_9PEZI